jgi:hypothetical protein
MLQKHRIGFNVSLLLVFLVLTLCINFLHHHTGLQGGNSCPACHFQNTTLLTAQIDFFISPQLTLLDTLRICQSLRTDQVILITPTSRSPPLV